jgi:hypothetical protein
MKLASFFLERYKALQLGLILTKQLNNSIFVIGDAMQTMPPTMPNIIIYPTRRKCIGSGKRCFGRVMMAFGTLKNLRSLMLCVLACLPVNH